MRWRTESRLAHWRAASIVRLAPVSRRRGRPVQLRPGRSLERIPHRASMNSRCRPWPSGFTTCCWLSTTSTLEAWIISQGFPAVEHAARRRRAAERPTVSRVSRAAIWPACHVRHERRLAIEPIRPAVGRARPQGLTSNLSPQRYLAAIERAIEYIRAGDVFQVNIAQRLLFPAQDRSDRSLPALRTRNPAPFAGYFDMGALRLPALRPSGF